MTGIAPSAQRIAADYAAAVPVKIIAHTYGVRPQAVSVIAKAAGLTSKLRRYDLHHDEIVTRYDAGESAAQIARALRLPEGGMRRWLGKRGYKLRPGPRKLGETKPFLVADLVQDYLDQHTAAEVGMRYGVSEATVRYYVRKAGFAVRPRGSRRRSQ